MEQLSYVIMSSVQLFLKALMILLFLRVIIGFFSEDSESKFYMFCCVVTEPIVAPIRALLSLIPGLNEFPIDFSFMATYLVLTIVQYALPVSF